ncbi:hypothetical protein TGDOM2_263450 [Toxoplasma gondii GAB2-2007-GAL-DOM2]|uniref:HTH La-type RNA-binding domain-containing protein n=3 Tax=Toxoplasma gondii TaxID=5811 RepID=V4YUB6_TOXGV|nr:hypothetical protein TGVEG_263450 [Toxoplasma gondii VEG]KFG30892.1 hypothetical protein TGDOM2_263450 [Toxoplasma gondii GAB2-2007-GAL-DOM2]KFG34890.1 hypothetical protein TGP89_263450 [Toxoplasma gondii p89]CEL74107.1 TPA: hypothetical protein BN1205_049455 [Toxoplasma gondii VEG]
MRIKLRFCSHFLPGREAAGAHAPHPLGLVCASCQGTGSNECEPVHAGDACQAPPGSSTAPRSIRSSSSGNSSSSPSSTFASSSSSACLCSSLQALQRSGCVSGISFAVFEDSCVFVDRRSVRTIGQLKAALLADLAQGRFPKTPSCLLALSACEDSRNVNASCFAASSRAAEVALGKPVDLMLRLENFLLPDNQPIDLLDKDDVVTVCLYTPVPAQTAESPGLLRGSAEAQRHSLLPATAAGARKRERSSAPDPRSSGGRPANHVKKGCKALSAGDALDEKSSEEESSEEDSSEEESSEEESSEESEEEVPRKPLQRRGKLQRMPLTPGRPSKAAARETSGRGPASGVCTPGPKRAAVAALSSDESSTSSSSSSDEEAPGSAAPTSCWKRDPLSPAEKRKLSAAPRVLHDPKKTRDDGGSRKPATPLPAGQARQTPSQASGTAAGSAGRRGTSSEGKQERKTEVSSSDSDDSAEAPRVGKELRRPNVARMPAVVAKAFGLAAGRVSGVRQPGAGEAVASADARQDSRCMQPRNGGRSQRHPQQIDVEAHPARASPQTQETPMEAAEDAGKPEETGETGGSWTAPPAPEALIPWPSASLEKVKIHQWLQVCFLTLQGFLPTLSSERLVRVEEKDLTTGRVRLWEHRAPNDRPPASGGRTPQARRRGTGSWRDWSSLTEIKATPEVVHADAEGLDSSQTASAGAASLGNVSQLETVDGEKGGGSGAAFKYQPKRLLALQQQTVPEAISGNALPSESPLRFTSQTAPPENESHSNSSPSSSPASTAASSSSPSSAGSPSCSSSALALSASAGVETDAALKGRSSSRSEQTRETAWEAFLLSGLEVVVSEDGSDLLVRHFAAAGAFHLPLPRDLLDACKQHMQKPRATSRAKKALQGGTRNSTASPSVGDREGETARNGDVLLHLVSPRTSSTTAADCNAETAETVEEEKAQGDFGGDEKRDEPHALVVDLDAVDACVKTSALKILREKLEQSRKALRRQLDFYFSPSNWSKDTHLRSVVQPLPAEVANVVQQQRLNTNRKTPSDSSPTADSSSDSSSASSDVLVGVPLREVAAFPRVQALTADEEFIAECMRCGGGLQFVHAEKDAHGDWWLIRTAKAEASDLAANAGKDKKGNPEPRRSRRGGRWGGLSGVVARP